jgi:hypothetical protein
MDPLNSNSMLHEIEDDFDSHREDIPFPFSVVDCDDENIKKQALNYDSYPENHSVENSSDEENENSLHHLALNIHSEEVC